LTRSGTLPTGVSFVDTGNGTATISGTPTQLGDFPLTLTAANGVIPDATQSFTLKVVGVAPAITSAARTTFTVGVNGSFAVTTTGTPRPSISISGALPGGVAFADNGDGTATISGTATTSGTFNVTLTANNGVAPDAVQSFALTVNGPPMTLTPSSIDFGTVYLASPMSKTVLLANPGAATLQNIKVGLVLGAGARTGDYVLVDSCGSSRAPGKSCKITVLLSALRVGTPTAKIQVTANGLGSPQEVPLTAVVINPIALFDPLILSFPPTKVGTPVTESAKLRNVGTTPLIITGMGISGRNAADFTQTNNCPASLAAGASCTFQVTFKPGAKGLRSSSLKVTDNARTGTQSLPLSGFGKEPPRARGGRRAPCSRPSSRTRRPVHLRSEHSKNEESRVIALTRDLLAPIQPRWAERQYQAEPSLFAVPRPALGPAPRLPTTVARGPVALGAPAYASRPLAPSPPP
jgi:hypothetical protein